MRLLLLALTGALGLLLGLTAGAEGWSLSPSAWAQDAALILELRLPRSASAWLAGAALGLAGAIAQGLFRNPLADPYLLGSAAGAHLGVSLALVAGATLTWPVSLGVPLAAFLGALGGVLLSLMLAGTLHQGTPLLLAGVIVGMLLGTGAEMLSLIAPEILRARQAFLLGTTVYADAGAVALLGLAVAVAGALAWPAARVLDALTLGEDAAATLGLPVRACRIGLLAALALATGAAVSQVGLVGFIGLVAPHLVRAMGTRAHRALLLQSACCGGALLVWADAFCRGWAAPSEWPVGLMTASLGGAYLLVLLRRRGRPSASGPPP
jgi:iron complex transport system permease protein